MASVRLGDTKVAQHALGAGKEGRDVVGQRCGHIAEQVGPLRQHMVAVAVEECGLVHRRCVHDLL
jgi:hypothetical protein